MYIDTEWFQHGAIPHDALQGKYNSSLLVLAFFIASLASFVAYDMLDRLRSESKKINKVIWLTGGSIVFGAGIWSMNFIGVLAFTLPVPIAFDLIWTFLSLFIPIIIIWIIFFQLRNNIAISHKKTIVLGTFIAVAIILSHHAAAQGMEINIEIVYIIWKFIFAILTAIIFSQLGLWLYLKSYTHSLVNKTFLKALSALATGAGITGIHYISMNAAVITLHKTNIPPILVAVGHNDIALYTVMITGAVIGFSLIASTYRQLVLNQQQQDREKEYTKEILAAKNLLEERVEQRTFELSAKNKQLAETLDNLNAMKDKLIQSEKMATLGQLSAGIAHEINNPLSFILSNMNTLEKRIANADYHDSKEIVSESVEGLLRIKKIVADLKTFSGTERENVQKNNINTCIESAISLIWNELKNKCVLNKKFSELPPILCSYAQIESVFINLLLNAGQSITENGEITIESFVNKENEIEVRISDNGHGISAENLKKLFTPFFTTKPVGTGTGLGLAVSYGIVKKYNGRITVESVVGKGTTFTVFLPCEG